MGRTRLLGHVLQVHADPKPQTVAPAHLVNQQIGRLHASSALEPDLYCSVAVPVTYNAPVTIPTTVISGHLGAGKTSAILHLLSQRPDTERWAIVVNEFGEVGVDGAVLEDARQQARGDGLVLKEITGACICCGLGAPLLYVLERLLEVGSFDRLIIEPTGLAEPSAVIDSFGAVSIRDAVIRRATICLVDMRRQARDRFAGHATFQRQLHAADIVIGNFADLSSAGEKAAFIDDMATIDPAKERIVATTRGAIDAAVLDVQPVLSRSVVATPADHGAVSRSWRFGHDIIFDRAAVHAVFEQHAAVVWRAKAILRTAYGHKRGELDGAGTIHWQPVPSARDSRFDFVAPISDRIDELWGGIDRALGAAQTTL